MFAALRTASVARASTRAFSSSASRADFAKLTLVGHLGKSPELKMTKTDKEYISYSVATNSPLASDTEGRRNMKTTWHTVLSFNPNSNTYLQTVPKGALVYVEAAYELREPEPEADPESPQGQRQIFLRHEMIRVLKYPKAEGPEGISEE